MSGESNIVISRFEMREAWRDRHRETRHVRYMHICNFFPNVFTFRGNTKKKRKTYSRVVCSLLFSFRNGCYLRLLSVRKLLANIVSSYERSALLRGLCTTVRYNFLVRGNGVFAYNLLTDFSRRAIKNAVKRNNCIFHSEMWNWDNSLTKGLNNAI